jgi:hypothetical protein
VSLDLKRPGNADPNTMNTRKPSAHQETIIVFGRECICLFEGRPGGVYTTTCHDIPDAMVFGATLDEARESIREELAFWLSPPYEPSYSAYS